ncbi:uncharacterized protein LOC113206601 isoform X3 [Frankliniella occidentalis]|uniref:Uncharacterized protein LOC113206601 isoform X3 n=1 Tax=Frankliniella occidentalis TaxID=133901 RepID=A0A9C6UA64_FRAOC|nr:uncharacterized protein LOC113206601 isoform X3 [Frankliniella occidentalis]
MKFEKRPQFEGMASTKEDEEDRKCRDSDAFYRSNGKVERSNHSNGSSRTPGTDQSQEKRPTQAAEPRVGATFLAHQCAKNALNMRQKCSICYVGDNGDVNDVLEHMSRLDINVEESPEERQCKTEQSIAQDEKSISNVRKTKALEQASKLGSKISFTSLTCATQDAMASPLKKDPDNGKATSKKDELAKPENSRIGCKLEKSAIVKQNQSKDLFITDPATEKNVGSNKRQPSATESDLAKSDSSETRLTTDSKHDCSDKVYKIVEDFKKLLPRLEKSEENKSTTHSSSEYALSSKSERHEESPRKDTEPAQQKNGTKVFTETKQDQDSGKVEQILQKFRSMVSKQSVIIMRRGPTNVPIGPHDELDSLLRVSGPLREFTFEEIDEFLKHLGDSMTQQVPPQRADSIDSSPHSSAGWQEDSGMEDSSGCYTPPSCHEILSVDQGHGTPISSPSCSMTSSMSPYSAMDSPLPQNSYYSGESPMTPPSPPFNQNNFDVTLVKTSWPSEFGPNHKYMRSMFHQTPSFTGYGTSGHPDRIPHLIIYLKAADGRRPDFQKIFESARCYLLAHIALLYEEDTEGYTALYYAAKLHGYDKIVGFILECLIEAEHKCSLIKDPAKSQYRIELERYGNFGDNILHCLARWHNEQNNYIPVAETLFSTCSKLMSLKLERNKEGFLPYELCQRSDMKMFLHPHAY